MTLRHFAGESEEQGEREPQADHSLSFAALSLLSYVLSVNVGVGVDAGSSVVAAVVVVALSLTLFRKQVVVVTHTNTGAAKQKRRVYFSLPFLPPPFSAIFTNSQLIRKKINNTSFISSIHSQLHTLHYCELSNRYRLSFLICYFLFATPTRTRNTLRSQQKSLDNWNWSCLSGCSDTRLTMGMGERERGRENVLERTERNVR